MNDQEIKDIGEFCIDTIEQLTKYRGSLRQVLACHLLLCSQQLSKTVARCPSPSLGVRNGRYPQKLARIQDHGLRNDTFQTNLMSYPQKQRLLGRHHHLLQRSHVQLLHHLRHHPSRRYEWRVHSFKGGAENNSIAGQGNSLLIFPLREEIHRGKLRLLIDYKEIETRPRKVYSRGDLSILDP